MIVELSSTAAGDAAVARRDRPDPGGIVRRGAAAEFVASYAEEVGGAPRCRVGAGGKGHLFTADCARPAVMEVYGLAMCEVHGEEAAAGALEEIYHDLEMELQRPERGLVSPLSPHLAAALHRGFDVLDAEGKSADYRAEGLLLAAFPLDRANADGESVAYAEDPEAHRGHEAPSDMFRNARLLLHRHMRLAFEAEADWLVEMLEGERVQVAAQCAYALALEREAFGPSGGEGGRP